MNANVFNSGVTNASESSSSIFSANVSHAKYSQFEYVLGDIYDGFTKMVSHLSPLDLNLFYLNVCIFFKCGVVSKLKAILFTFLMVKNAVLCCY